jgi:hypothetical protein
MERFNQCSPEEIREAAIARVATLFGVNPRILEGEMVFGSDLVASFVSDFRHNELDKVDHDIRDVADRESLAAFSSGTLVIRTVADYCEHMIKSYRTNPEEVVRLLGLKDE